MTRTLLDVATFAVYGVCTGYAGWWARSTVDHVREVRMNRRAEAYLRGDLDL